MLRFVTGVRLVFLTVNEDPDIAAEAIGLGESGYLLKSSASGELFTSILLRQATKPGAEKLTSRQREVLQLLAEGRAMKEVADLLQLSTRTVAFHKYTIIEHLGVKTSAELVQYVLEHGMLKKQT